MRKVVVTLAALAAFGIALPVDDQHRERGDSSIIKKGHRDHGHHYGWRNHRAERVVVVKKHRYHHNRGAAVVVR